MKSTSYDKRIEQAEAQLKLWKAERKKLATKEAKAAKKVADKKREVELRKKGHEYEEIEEWMKSHSVTNGEVSMTIWDGYQHYRRRYKRAPAEGAGTKNETE